MGRHGGLQFQLPKTVSQIFLVLIMGDKISREDTIRGITSLLCGELYWRRHLRFSILFSLKKSGFFREKMEKHFHL